MVPAPVSRAAELVRTIANPVRLRIVGALDRRPMTVAEISVEIGADRRSTWRHLRQMERAGVVCGTPGPRGTVFQVVADAHFDEEDYAQLPVAMRRAGIAVTLANIQATAASALIDGGFDRDDVHISRTTLTLAADDWLRVADELADTLERVAEIRDQTSTPRPPKDAVHATAVLMLYATGTHQGPADRPADATAFGREEALLRAWDSTEALADLLVPAGATDWAAVMDQADQLRVVAGAALEAERHDGPASDEAESPG